MRKLVLILLPLTVLAACSSEPAEEPAAEETAAAEAPAVTAANGSPVGAYEATAADGTVTTTTLNADGSYTDTDATGATVAEGTWAVTDGKTCFMPTTEGVTPMCYTESAPAADGSFTATPDEGEAVTVKPAAAAAPAAEEAPAE